MFLGCQSCRKINKIAFLGLIRDQEVPSSNLGAPTNLSFAKTSSYCIRWKNSRPKTAVSARCSASGSLGRDVIGLVEPLRRLVPAWREAGCSSRDQGMAGPSCNQLRSAPFVAMEQATNLRDLHDLSSLRLVHDASCRSVLPVRWGPCRVAKRIG